MKDFETVYQSAVGSKEGIDPALLRPLLKPVYVEALRKPTDRKNLKDALVSLSRFLASPEGRTSDYCWAVDYFFEDIDELWKPEIYHLSSDFKEVFDEFRFLHGVVDQPQFHTIPEELLEMIERIDVE